MGADLMKNYDTATNTLEKNSEEQTKSILELIKKFTEKGKMISLSFLLPIHNQEDLKTLQLFYK